MNGVSLGYVGVFFWSELIFANLQNLVKIFLNEFDGLNKTVDPPPSVFLPHRFYAQMSKSLAIC